MTLREMTKDGIRAHSPFKNATTICGDARQEYKLENCQVNLKILAPLSTVNGEIFLSGDMCGRDRCKKLGRI